MKGGDEVGRRFRPLNHRRKTPEEERALAARHREASELKRLLGKPENNRWMNLGPREKGRRKKK